MQTLISVNNFVLIIYGLVVIDFYLKKNWSKTWKKNKKRALFF